MGKKENFLNNTLLGFAIKNILIATAVIIAFSAIMFVALNFYTKHGKTETVPALKGLLLNDAILMLERHNLKYEIIDSVFLRDKKLGTIIEQNPSAETTVKPGRSIYLIINSKAIRKIIIPDLRDISLRQAKAMASSMGINIENVEYVASEYKDLVIDVKFNGQSLLTGTAIPEGANIVLVAGSGYREYYEGGAPMLIGLNLSTAIDVLSSSSFRIGSINYDVQPNNNEELYIIIGQYPEAGEPTSDDASIDLWLSKDQAPRIRDNSNPIHSTKKGNKSDKDIEEFF